jgi:hypothetical protein
MPNMNMQIAHTISPVRMFLRASHRVIMGGKDYLMRASGPRSARRPPGSGGREPSIAFQAPIS